MLTLLLELPQKLQAVLLQYVQESMRRRGRSRAGGGARMDSIRNSESKKTLKELARVFGFGSPTIVTQPLFSFQVLDVVVIERLGSQIQTVTLFHVIN